VYIVNGIKSTFSRSYGV